MNFWSILLYLRRDVSCYVCVNLISHIQTLSFLIVNGINSAGFVKEKPLKTWAMVAEGAAKLLKWVTMIADCLPDIYRLNLTSEEFKVRTLICHRAATRTTHSPWRGVLA